VSIGVEDVDRGCRAIRRRGEGVGLIAACGCQGRESADCQMLQEQTDERKNFSPWLVPGRSTGPRQFLPGKQSPRKDS